MSEIDKLLVQQPAEYTLTEDYRAYMESMLVVLRNANSTTKLNIDPEKGYLYRGDFSSFLLDNDVPLEDHRLIMRVNGMNSIMDFDESVSTLLIPDQNLISQLKQLYRSRQE